MIRYLGRARVKVNMSGSGGKSELNSDFYCLFHCSLPDHNVLNYIHVYNLDIYYRYFVILVI